MGDVRTERGDLVPERWAELYRDIRHEPPNGAPYIERPHHYRSTIELLELITELASWQARAEAAEKLATHLDQLQSDYAQKYCAETASRLQWQARAEQAEARIERIRTPKVYEGPYYTLAEHPERCPECDNRTWISCGAKGMCCHVCMLICELDQAESTIAAWKKDAEDRDKVIAELTAEVKRLKEAALDATGKLITLSSSAYHLAEVARAMKRWEDAIWNGQMEPQPAPLSLMQSIDSALNALPLGGQNNG